ncbi:hypothetical protein BX616_010800, partial [Lobosporangium transversale]
MANNTLSVPSLETLHPEPKISRRAPNRSTPSEKPQTSILHRLRKSSSKQLKQQQQQRQPQDHQSSQVQHTHLLVRPPPLDLNKSTDTSPTMAQSSLPSAPCSPASSISFNSSSSSSPSSSSSDLHENLESHEHDHAHDNAHGSSRRSSKDSTSSQSSTVPRTSSHGNSLARLKQSFSLKVKGRRVGTDPEPSPASDPVPIPIVTSTSTSTTTTTIVRNSSKTGATEKAPLPITMKASNQASPTVDSFSRKKSTLKRWQNRGATKLKDWLHIQQHPYPNDQNQSQNQGQGQGQHHRHHLVRHPSRRETPSFAPPLTPPSSPSLRPVIGTDNNSKEIVDEQINIVAQEPEFLDTHLLSPNVEIPTATIEGMFALQTVSQDENHAHDLNNHVTNDNDDTVPVHRRTSSSDRPLFAYSSHYQSAQEYQRTHRRRRSDIGPSLSHKKVSASVAAAGPGRIPPRSSSLPRSFGPRRSSSHNLPTLNKTRASQSISTEHHKDNDIEHSIHDQDDYLDESDPYNQIYPQSTTILEDVLEDNVEEQELGSELRLKLQEQEPALCLEYPSETVALEQVIVEPITPPSDQRVVTVDDLLDQVDEHLKHNVAQQLHRMAHPPHRRRLHVRSLPRRQLWAKLELKRREKKNCKASKSQDMKSPRSLQIIKKIQINATSEKEEEEDANSDSDSLEMLSVGSSSSQSDVESTMFELFRAIDEAIDETSDTSFSLSSSDDDGEDQEEDQDYAHGHGHIESMMDPDDDNDNDYDYDYDYDYERMDRSFWSSSSCTLHDAVLPETEQAAKMTDLTTITTTTRDDDEPLLSRKK